MCYFSSQTDTIWKVYCKEGDLLLQLQQQHSCSHLPGRVLGGVRDVVALAPGKEAQLAGWLAGWLLSWLAGWSAV